MVTVVAAASAGIGALSQLPLALALAVGIAAWLGSHVKDDPRLVVRMAAHPIRRFMLTATLATAIGFGTRALFTPAWAMPSFTVVGIALGLVLLTGFAVAARHDARARRRRT